MLLLGLLLPRSARAFLGFFLTAGLAAALAICLLLDFVTDGHHLGPLSRLDALLGCLVCASLAFYFWRLLKGDRPQRQRAFNISHAADSDTPVPRPTPRQATMAPPVSLQPAEPVVEKEKADESAVAPVFRMTPRVGRTRPPIPAAPQAKDSQS